MQSDWFRSGRNSSILPANPSGFVAWWVARLQDITMFNSKSSHTRRTNVTSSLHYLTTNLNPGYRFRFPCINKFTLHVFTFFFFFHFTGCGRFPHAADDSGKLFAGGIQVIKFLGSGLWKSKKKLKVVKTFFFFCFRYLTTVTTVIVICHPVAIFLNILSELYNQRSTQSAHMPRAAWRLWS